MKHTTSPASTESASRPATHPVTAQRRYPAAPMIGAAAVVIDEQGHVLLVKRGRPPRAGSWGLPGGLLDLGERLADGARREVLEETGIQIEVKDVVGTFEPIQLDGDGRIEYHYVVIDFWARPTGGEVQAQDDADAVVWASTDELDCYELNDDTRHVVEAALAAWRADDGGSRLSSA